MLISTNTAKVRAAQRSRRRKKVATATVGTCRLTNYLRVMIPDTLEALPLRANGFEQVERRRWVRSEPRRTRRSQSRERPSLPGSSLRGLCGLCGSLYANRDLGLRVSPRQESMRPLQARHAFAALALGSPLIADALFAFLKILARFVRRIGLPRRQFTAVRAEHGQELLVVDVPE